MGIKTIRQHVSAVSPVSEMPFEEHFVIRDSSLARVFRTRAAQNTGLGERLIGITLLIVLLMAVSQLK